MTKEIQAREDEVVCAASSSGTLSTTVECTELFRKRINDEFTFIALSFRSVSANQSNDSRAYAETILAILEDKGATAISR